MSLLKTKTVVEPKTVSIINQMLELNQWCDNHPLQREADQWNKEERDGFIATVTKGEDFDSIKLCVEDSVIWLIDGKQRLTTIRLFRNNGFALGKNIEMPIVEYMSSKGEIENFDLRGKRFNDFPPELQLQFDSCQVTVVKQLDCTPAETAYHFRRYNHNKSLNNNQSSITYAEDKARLIKEISDHKFFLDCGKYTAKERKNGALGKIIMESIMSTFHIDNWKKQANKIGAYINKNVNESEFDILSDYLDRLYYLCEEKYQSIFNSKNTFIFIATFDRFIQFGLEDSRFVEFLDEFEANLHSKVINNVSYDDLDKNRATKDKGMVIKKINHLEQLMRQYFNIEDSVDEGDLTNFIKRNVNDNITEQDISDYETDLGEMVGNSEVVNKIHNSLVAMVAYGYKEDVSVEIQDWLINYISQNQYYFSNQKKNYLHMLDDFKKYLSKNAA